MQEPGYRIAAWKLSSVALLAAAAAAAAWNRNK